MRKEIKGSMTIEAAVIVPLILWVFMLIVLMLFYSHDKNVISVIAHETVVKASGDEAMTAEEIETYFQKRLNGKLLLFSWVDTEIKSEKEEICFGGTARRHRMALKIDMKMKRTEPEKMIRNIRRIGAIK